MDEQSQAHQLVQKLSSAEREALIGLMNGESVSDLARRLSVEDVTAADIRECMKWKLGVLRDADAVRIALIAEFERA